MSTNEVEEIHLDVRKTAPEQPLPAGDEMVLLAVKEKDLHEEVESPAAKRQKENQGTSPKNAVTHDEMRKKRLEALEEQQRKRLADCLAVSRGVFKKRAWESEQCTRDRPTDLPQVVDPEAFVEPTEQTQQADVAATPSTSVAPLEPVGETERKNATVESSASTAPCARTPVVLPETEAPRDQPMESADGGSPTSGRQTGPQHDDGQAESSEAPLFPEDFEVNALDNLAVGLRQGRTDPLVAAAALGQSAKRIRAMQEEMAGKEQVADHYGRILGMMQMLLNSAGLNKDMSQEQRDAATAAERPKNYMIKRGDVLSTPDAQAKAKEAHQSHVDQTPRILNAATNLTRDEMDQQRKDRLSRLEKQLETARKEREETDRKSKAREAMFERSLPTGAGKPLGNK
eukprot:GEMP01013955.1.p1 GENE.GEMP01013955.1~~GEMP01013955.1.p1  ORF type:complete len:401 (+),score=103.88 GEMP01013955.1:48-1250(+)